MNGVPRGRQISFFWRRGICRARGTQVIKLVYPALKRWAILCRAQGAVDRFDSAYGRSREGRGRSTPDKQRSSSDYGQQISLSSTATCAIAVLSVPMPSGVLALIPTHEGSTPSSSATCCWIALACGPILGAARINVLSTFPT